MKMNCYEEVAAAEFQVLKDCYTRFNNFDLTEKDIKEIAYNIWSNENILVLIHDEIYKYIEENFTEIVTTEFIRKEVEE